MSTPAALLHQMKPQGYGDNPLVEKLRVLAAEIQEQTDEAHKLIAEVHQPDDLGHNDLIDWQDRKPLQIEYSEDRRGNFEFIGIRVRGVDVSEFISEAIMQEAEDEVAGWKEARCRDAQEARADYLMDLHHEEKAA